MHRSGFGDRITDRPAHSAGCVPIWRRVQVRTTGISLRRYLRIVFNAGSPSVADYRHLAGSHHFEISDLLLK